MTWFSLRRENYAHTEAFTGSSTFDKAGNINAFLVGGVIVTLLAGYAALRVSALREAVATARPETATTS